MTPRIDRERLLGRLDSFNRIGALAGGGNWRLAPSDEDRGLPICRRRRCACAS